jgi:tripartite-type tricarboxylate transporter receptor subunit TctC
MAAHGGCAGSRDSRPAFGQAAGAVRQQAMKRGIIALALVLALGGAAAAQTYPTKPIKLIVPFAPGGPADVLGRIIGQQAGIILGQSFVVENRGGAGGTIGARLAAQAEPDGYTLMFANTSTLSINPAVYKNLDFDPAKAFVPVALVGTTSNIVVVTPALPVKSIAYGKANPGKLSYSSPGVGTPPHMIGELFKLRTGLDITHVPYKSGGSSTQDVVSGQVPMTFENPAVSLPLVLAGTIRAIAVTSEARNPRLPDVPTMSETIPDFVSVSFTGVVAPAGVSPAIIGKLNAAINASLEVPEVMATLAKLSVDIKAGTPAEFGAFLANEREKWQGVAKAAHIQID